jgi:transglutaminase-like putative cysteine protease
MQNDIFLENGSHINHRTGAQISLTGALNVVTAVGALLAFFMGREHISEAYTTGFFALFVIAAFIEWRDLPHPPRLLVDLATLAALGAIFARVRRNYIIEALMEAILLMIAVKMLEDKRPRDYVQIVLLDLSMVISYAMLSAEKTFIVYCFGRGLVSTLILLLTTWFGKEPDAFMSAGELRQFFGRTCAIFAAMLPLCLLLFFGLPRTTMPLFGTRGQYGSSVTGFSDQVRLGDAVSIQMNNKLAFRVEMDSLGDQTPYWRGMVLDFFEGSMWVSSKSGASRGPFVPDAGARYMEQQIFLEAGNRGYLFALDQPIDVSGLDTISDGDGAFRYNSPRNIGRRLQYSAISVLSSRMKPANPEIDRRRYLGLPPDFIPRLRALTEERTRGMAPRAKIADVMSFLSSPEFSYSLEGLPNARDALEQFLFVGKKGNCEYFAAAMGVMLRMAGVPARLVAGYRGGVYNDAGGYYIVQEQNAHVWVEAWDEEAGAWVRYDPTPIGEGAGSGLSAYDTIALYLDLLDYQWSKLVVNYNWEAQMDLVQNLREVVHNPRASLTPTRDGFRRFSSALSVPAIVLGTLTAGAALFYLLRALRNRRPEMELLHKFLRVMKRHGYRRHKSEGLSEFLARVSDARLRLLALPFVRGFEEFYYKDRPMDAATLRILRNRLDRIS